MESRPPVLQSVVADLRKVERWLSRSLGVSVDDHEFARSRDPFSAPDDLEDLRGAIDRIRPLLWMYLKRQNEARELNVRPRPASLSDLLDEQAPSTQPSLHRHD